MNHYVIALITSLYVLCLTSWILYRRVADSNALSVGQQKYGKSKIRRMGTLSELWQILYERNCSPIIHAFEYGPDCGYNFLTEFWSSFSTKYVNWRCIPIKICGRWFWKELDDKEFNIKDHCKCITLKSNGNAKQALVKWLNSNNMNKPFDPNKPHWEAYYIKFDDSNKVYAYGRVNHSIGDGVLLNRICEMEHDVLWSTNKNKSEKQTAKVKKINIKNKKSFRNVLFIIYNLMKYTPFFIYDLISLVLFESAPSDCGIHCDYYNGKNTLQANMIQRKFNIGISNKFLLKDIKKLCKTYGDNYTINDFVLTVFCESVYRYIFKYVCKNEKYEYEKITNKHGNKLYLRFFTVFNMRSLIEKDLEKLSAIYSEGVDANKISIVPIRLPCGDIPFVDRFNEIHNLFYKLKNSPMAIYLTFMLQIGHFLFGLKFVNMILGELVASKCTFALSNLVGPKKPLLSGLETNNDYVCNMFNATNPTHTPLSCGIMSYVDHITFTLIADQNAIYEPNEFIDCLNNVYNKSLVQL